MLSFVALCPHPPVMLPEIGKEDVQVMEKTINAMLKLSLSFAQAKPELVIVISPHAPVLHDRIALGYGQELIGNFDQFGHPEVAMSFVNNRSFVDQIVIEAFKEKVATDAYVTEDDIVALDHGAMVPLYFLSKAHTMFDVILSSVSDLSITKHFYYGQALKKAIDGMDKRVAVIISGDLSHRLQEDGPYGFHPSGPLFDQILLEHLEKKHTEQLLHIPLHLVDEAGECGYRGIAVMQGVLDGVGYTPHVLSYEGPWGVGYAVCEMKLNEGN